MLGLIILCSLGSLIAQSQDQKSRQKKTQPKEIYTRPKPTVPIKPQIPSINRYQKDKIFLENADSLYRREADGYEHQIVSGNVKFRQGNMWMFCDSAYYYPEFNSLNAFGHVKMEQGDTLFVYADKLFYNGQTKQARLRCGATQPTVRLINRSTKLTTDSLDYDLARQLGWYEHGGKLDDGINTLTSIYGNYSPSTKDAEFRDDVELINNKDGFRLTTSILHYNTRTNIARIDAPTLIEGRNDVIRTNSGWYNTRTDNAELLARSIIEHTDSSGNVITLDGDHIVYDKANRVSKAYMFEGPSGKPMVLTDTARKSILYGDYGEYDELRRTAFATGHPLLIEYSRPDTNFLRADTILTLITTEKIFEPEIISKARENYELLKKEIIEEATLSGDSVPVIPPQEPLDSSLMVEKDFYTAKALRNARFFNQTVQGVADSIIYTEIDSMARMYVKPVAWSGERQISGTEIHVHLNDSTADRAFIPDKSFLIEHVEEDFYNQLKGKELHAFFENNDLRHLELEQNVQTIFLPQEQDSTYSKLIQAESSFLTVDMTDRKLDKLKMWPDVTGSVSPLFLIKKRDQKFLPDFQWLEGIRPKRVWYGDRIKWEDDLGIVPDDLLNYFGHTEESPSPPTVEAPTELEP
ncbi:MAG: LPS export ABC transporter periplasmic protein LptC [Prevotella sp.]|nr:LPS export ABC transporter periplasmic protein LptC [Bacteroides sp.]MCM1366164.1 LPS export ABC transporter periplasmic protein LptC [Prevotella sp.]MCM1436771.1 LPS export ABC transporter periplasmic protein LptC [Prevotella sp.]